MRPRDQLKSRPRQFRASSPTRRRFDNVAAMPGGEDKAAHRRVTVRELRGLLAADWPTIDIAPAEAGPGDLVTLEDKPGYQFLSRGGGGTLLARPDLRADQRKPQPTTADKVVAAHHRLGEGDFVIVEAVATPRLGRIETVEHAGGRGEVQYMVRSLLGGERWATSRLRYHAGQVWPVPMYAATALLTRTGLPAPPASRV